MATKLAVILVRGFVKMPQPIEDTLIMLKLHKKNYCVILSNTPANKGMINKVKDYVAWGELNEDTFNQIVHKRGEAYEGRLMHSHQKYSYNVLEFEGKKYKPYFRLNAPLKGYGRKGIKVSYPVGGALGYRGEKINDLIKRML